MNTRSIRAIDWSYVMPNRQPDGIWVSTIVGWMSVLHATLLLATYLLGMPVSAGDVVSVVLTIVFLSALATVTLRVWRIRENNGF
jgi:VIT1/CCC1 family predicted Fe2+/Mn2+ transporter